MTVSPSYSLGDPIEVASERTLYRYAIIVPDGRVVMRKRSNGQTFELVYHSAMQARRGLNLARAEAYPDAELWDRKHPGGGHDADD